MFSLFPLLNRLIIPLISKCVIQNCRAFIYTSLKFCFNPLCVISLETLQLKYLKHGQHKQGVLLLGNTWKCIIISFLILICFSLCNYIKWVFYFRLQTFEKHAVSENFTFEFYKLLTFWLCIKALWCSIPCNKNPFLKGSSVGNESFTSLS